MDVDACNNLEDASDQTIRALSDVIQSSRTEEHLVYRETELDELWRFLHVERSLADGAPDAELDGKIDLVMEVHDLVGEPASASGALAAAERLRTLIS